MLGTSPSSVPPSLASSSVLGTAPLTAGVALPGPAAPPSGQANGAAIPDGAAGSPSIAAARYPAPFAPVVGELVGLERRLASHDGVEFPLLSHLLDATFGGGGKRIRPALIFAAARLGAGAPDGEGVMNLAAAVETLHAATLVHDDLVDGALLRRGQPTLNTRWSAGATVLAGDWLFARAARFAAATRNVRVVEIFARELGTLTDGELRQLFGREAVPSRAEYERRIYSKTASLFEAALEATAVLLGLSEDGEAALAGFGRELGMAFQVVDDILDFSSDVSHLGKPVGHDLRTGTVTLPALLYLAKEPDAAPWLADSPNGVPHGVPAAAVDGLVAAIRSDHGAIEGSWQVARQHVEGALALLDDAFASSLARVDLAAMAGFTVERRS